MKSYRFMKKVVNVNVVFDMLRTEDEFSRRHDFQKNTEDENTRSRRLKIS